MALVAIRSTRTPSLTATQPDSKSLVHALIAKVVHSRDGDVGSLPPTKIHAEFGLGLQQTTANIIYFWLALSTSTVHRNIVIAASFFLWRYRD